MTSFSLPLDLPLPLPSDADQLAFWQAQARACAFNGMVGGSQSMQYHGVHGQRHRTPLLHAAADLDTARVADLLDDPAVLADLRGEPRMPSLSAHSVMNDEDRGETALELVLYEELDGWIHAMGRDHQDSSAAEMKARATVGAAQEVLIALLLAAGAVPTATAWLATGFACNPALIDRMVNAGHVPALPGDPRLREEGLGSTPLHLVLDRFADNNDHARTKINVVERCVATLERLIELGWSVNDLDGAQKPPLVHALETGDIFMARWLIEHHASLTWPWLEEDALGLAAENGLIDLIVPLRNAGMPLDPSIPGTQESLQALAAVPPLFLNPTAPRWDHGPRPTQGLTPMERAAQKGHTAMVEHLLDLGVPASMGAVQALDRWIPPATSRAHTEQVHATRVRLERLLLLPVVGPGEATLGTTFETALSIDQEKGDVQPQATGRPRVRL